MSNWSQSPMPFGTPTVVAAPVDPMQRLEAQVNRLERVSWILTVGLVALAVIYVLSFF